MNNLTIILINIALILFIVGNIIEIITVNKMYKRIDEDELDKTIDEAIDKLLGDK